MLRLDVKKIIDNISNLFKKNKKALGEVGMNSYVRYSMYGFNHKHIVNPNEERYETTLTDNNGYFYDNHSFLQKVYINDQITEITFYMKSGIEARDHIKEIDIELERLCFNIIT